MTEYNLEERTAKFGESVITLCNRLPKNEITRPLITQLVKAATSVGANYCEADDAESRKHFLRMIAVALPEFKDQARIIWAEAREIHLIFNAIYRKIGTKKIGHSLGQLDQLD